MIRRPLTMLQREKLAAPQFTPFSIAVTVEVPMTAGR